MVSYSSSATSTSSGTSSTIITLVFSAVSTIIDNTSGLIGGVLLQRFQDFCGNWGSDGEVSSLGLETVLVSSVGDAVGSAIVAGVGELSQDGINFVIATRVLQLAGFLVSDAVLGFVTTRKISFCDKPSLLLT